MNPLEKAWQQLSATPAIARLSPELRAGMKVFYMAGAADAVCIVAQAPDPATTAALLAAHMIACPEVQEDKGACVSGGASVQ